MRFVSRTCGSPSVARVKFRFAFASSGAALSAICAALAASSRLPRSYSSFATTSAVRLREHERTKHPERVRHVVVAEILDALVPDLPISDGNIRRTQKKN